MDLHPDAQLGRRAAARLALLLALLLFALLPFGQASAAPGYCKKHPERAGCDTPPPPADTDGDGFPDTSDLCPTVAGVAPDGCPAPEPPPAGCTTTLRPGANVGTAIAAAADGSTVCLEPGSYPAIDTGADKVGVTVQPTSGVATLAGALFTEASGITLRGLDFTPDGVRMRGSRDMVLEGNRVHDIWRDPACPTGWGGGVGNALRVGITGSVRSERIVIRGNVIDGVTQDGLYIGSTDDLLVERNEFTHVYPLRCSDHSDSIQWVAARGVTIRQNWFHESTHGLQVHGPNTTTRSDGRIENNLMDHITSIGFNLYSVDGLAVVNNTVWDTGNLAVRMSNELDDDSQMHATVRNNIFEEYANTCGSCVSALERNLVGGDPGFVGLYELADGSPAVDAGTTTDAPTVDRLGRPRDAQPDIGAHEKQ